MSTQEQWDIHWQRIYDVVAQGDPSAVVPLRQALEECA
jgi:hypothetical protein